MFAIALWTESERRLVLARDRVGIKPLYICGSGEELYFGSELKAILIHPEIERNLEPGRPGLLSGAELRSRSVDAGRRHRKGHAGDMGGVARRRDAIGAVLDVPDAARRRSDAGSAREELDSLLQQSVREHLLSDVPLGIWLSGGMDSSTILHYALARIFFEG